MVKRIRTSLIIVSLAFVFTACGKGETPQPPAPVKKAPAAKPAAPEVKEPVETAGLDSTIDVRRRNPFQSHIVMMKGTDTAKKIRGPLECCELSQFKLLAVVLSGDSSYALIQAPDSKRYIVRRGDMMGAREGRIVRFEQRGIVVREVERDEDGKVVATTDTELKLPAEKIQ